MHVESAFYLVQLGDEDELVGGEEAVGLGKDVQSDVWKRGTETLASVPHSSDYGQGFCLRVTLCDGEELWEQWSG